MDLPAALISLLQQPATCYIATTMPDGSPQLTQVWVDTDGTNILINSVQGLQKDRNIARDPRVAVTVADPADPSAYWAVRGRVVGRTTDGGVAHIERLSERYLGRPYPWFGGRDQVRIILTVEAERIHSPR